MLKKTAAFGSLLTVLCATSTLAHGSNFRSGFLAGAHVGISNGSGTFNSNFDTNQLGQAQASGKARKTSALFGILGGYRHIFHDGLTAGFDISGDVYTNNELNTQIRNVIPLGVGFPFRNKLTRRYSIIPTINAGKIFCGRWHATLGLGVAISGFKQEITNLSPVGGVIKSAAASTTKIGFVPSLGVEYAMTQNISVVGKISYEIYGKINKKFGDQLTSPLLPGSSYTSSISPRYLNLKIGAIYRF